MSVRTTVHLVRHGEVFNPEKVLYGRLSGYRLSELGEQMAQRVGEYLAGRDITHLGASPLERAQQTARPLAALRGLEIHSDENLLEATNVFEGKRVSVGDGVLRKPSAWRHLYNPFKPSWGEPYIDLAARMRVAIQDARDAARGHEATLVSHQLPIWVARLDAERRHFWHDPRSRECALASITSITFEDNAIAAISYAEPCADLVARSNKGVGA